MDALPSEVFTRIRTPDSVMRLLLAALDSSKLEIKGPPKSLNDAVAPKDPAKAAVLLLLAAEGNAAAQFYFANYCQKTDQPGDAFHWYGEAAQQGLSVAHNNVAHCYETGTGTARNLEKAAEHYRMAAMTTNPDGRASIEGTYNYGRVLANGIGIKADFPLARSYLESAVELKHPDAAAELADLNKREKKAERPLPFFRRAKPAAGAEAG